jgi:thymidine phosphorylase
MLVKHPQEVLGTAKSATPVYAANAGTLRTYDAMAMATLARRHGAGRFDVDDVIDVHTGFVLDHQPGDVVDENTRLFTFYHNRALLPDEVASLLQMATVGAPLSPPVSRLLATVE